VSSVPHPFAGQLRGKVRTAAATRPWHELFERGEHRHPVRRDNNT
jgi:hypothetical protein